MAAHMLLVIVPSSSLLPGFLEGLLMVYRMGMGERDPR